MAKTNKPKVDRKLSEKKSLGMKALKSNGRVAIGAPLDKPMKVMITNKTVMINMAPPPIVDMISRLLFLKKCCNQIKITKITAVRIPNHALPRLA